jgi:RNA polymerase sigma-70 factor (ECF subfamily)
MVDIPLTRPSLLVRLRDARDEDAWAHFVDLYGPLVYGYLSHQRLQNADAADLCQDVLLAVAGAVNRLEYDPRRGAFHNWLFTIVRHRLSNWRRAQRKRPQSNNDPAIHRFVEQNPTSNGSEAEWEAEWQRRVFAWACEQVRADVTDSTWQAFWKTAMEDHPAQRVADQLGMSIAAVYRARSRVLARLKETVESARSLE